MTSSRTLQTHILRSLTRRQIYSPRIHFATRQCSYRQTPPSVRPVQLVHCSPRLYSTDSVQSTKYTFEDIKPLTASPSPSHILIDVREPHEYAAGHIPTALNMPIFSHPDALFLPEDEFLERFGFAKPPTTGNAEVVFYCKSGVRSRTAASLALQGGFERVGEYQGSWGDWVERGGGVEQ